MEQTPNELLDNPGVEAPIIEEVVLPSDIVPDEYAELTREELLAKLKENKEPPKVEAPIIEEVVVPQNIVDEFTTIYNKNEGKFTDEDYSALQEKGYSKEFVDTYIEGVKAKEIAAAEAIIAPYGTMDDYASAIAYVSTTWSPEQITQYNNALAKADPDTTSILVGSLMKEFKGRNSYEAPNAPITQTKAPAVQPIKGYETKADMVKDMGDKRYGKDIAYTKKVEEKMSITDMNKWYEGLSRGV